MVASDSLSDNNAMGLLDRLFQSDPRALLERAESLLVRGDAVKALHLAERARKGGSLAQSNQAEQLARRARDTLVQAALERAALAEESGFYEDAAEWIEAALDQVDDEGRRDELARRAAELAERAGEETRRRDAAALADALAPRGPDEDERDRPPLDLDDHYEALLNTLDDDVAERYEDRPEAFRRALVELNEGRVDAARPALEELAEEHPDDPVYRLERGRCRLLGNAFEDARRDLEAVWEVFGDEPLDHARTCSVPGMWAQAMLGLGQADALLERLDETAVPGEGDEGVCYHFGLALLATERFEDARRYLATAVKAFPSVPEFPHQLAAALVELGRRSEAVDLLERAIAPSCATGSCRRPAKHLPSLRSLAGLHLDAGDLERARALLTHVAEALNGKLEAEDHLLLAEYHQRRGDAESAREAAEQARRLRDLPQAG